MTQYATAVALDIFKKSPQGRAQKDPASARDLRTMLLNDQIRASAQQTASGKVAANRPLRADEYVDRRIQVYGDKDRAWFYARVRDYNSLTREHNLENEGQGDARSRTEWANVRCDQKYYNVIVSNGCVRRMPMSLTLPYSDAYQAKFYVRENMKFVQEKFLYERWWWVGCGAGGGCMVDLQNLE